MSAPNPKRLRMKQNDDVIFSEDTHRTKGRDAQRNNIMAAKILSQTLATTLGPLGMDKLLMDPYGNITVTNDGVTIMRQMKMDHPVAKMIVEVAKNQEEAVGDGTTTVVVLAGELLRQAELLLDKGIHPTIIAKGYRMAEKMAQTALDNISSPVKPTDEGILYNIALTAMTGKGSESHKDHLATLVVSAIKKSLSNVLEFPERVSDLVTVIGISGRKTTDSYLVNGVVLEKERVLESMPRKVEGNIALFSCEVDVRKSEASSLNLTDSGQYRELLEKEQEAYDSLVGYFLQNNIKIVVTERGVNDLVAHRLAQHNVMVIKRVSRTDMVRISKTFNMSINGEVNVRMNFQGDCLAHEIKQGDNRYTLLQSLVENPIVSLIIYGGTTHHTQELKRATEDALGDLFATLRCGKAVAGAGSGELAIAKQVRDYAETIRGKEQLCVMAYAEALESIPLALAENSGLDAIECLTNLRSAHKKGEFQSGLNVTNGNIMDAWREGVVEPLDTKRCALASATEAAEMILRIDDLLLGTPKLQNNEPPQA